MRHLFGPLRHLNPVVFDSEGGGGGGGNNDNKSSSNNNNTKPKAKPVTIGAVGEHGQYAGDGFEFVRNKGGYLTRTYTGANKDAGLGTDVIVAGNDSSGTRNKAKIAEISMKEGSPYASKPYSATDGDFLEFIKSGFKSFGASDSYAAQVGNANYLSGGSDSSSSFDDAFAAARKDKGPGQTFDYQGKSYTTDYAPEVSLAPESSLRPQLRPEPALDFNAKLETAGMEDVSALDSLAAPAPSDMIQPDAGAVQDYFTTGAESQGFEAPVDFTKTASGNPFAAAAQLDFTDRFNERVTDNAGGIGSLPGYENTALNFQNRVDTPEQLEAKLAALDEGGIQTAQNAATSYADYTPDMFLRESTLPNTGPPSMGFPTAIQTKIMENDRLRAEAEAKYANDPGTGFTNLLGAGFKNAGELVFRGGEAGSNYFFPPDQYMFGDAGIGVPQLDSSGNVIPEIDPGFARALGADPNRRGEVAGTRNRVGTYLGGVADDIQASKEKQLDFIEGTKFGEAKNRNIFGTGAYGPDPMALFSEIVYGAPTTAAIVGTSMLNPVAGAGLGATMTTGELVTEIENRMDSRIANGEFGPISNDQAAKLKNDYVRQITPYAAGLGVVEGLTFGSLSRVPGLKNQFGLAAAEGFLSEGVGETTLAESVLAGDGQNMVFTPTFDPEGAAVGTALGGVGSVMASPPGFNSNAVSSVREDGPNNSGVASDGTVTGPDGGPMTDPSENVLYGTILNPELSPTAGNIADSSVTTSYDNVFTPIDGQSYDLSGFAQGPIVTPRADNNAQITDQTDLLDTQAKSDGAALLSEMILNDVSLEQSATTGNVVELASKLDLPMQDAVDVATEVSERAAREKADMLGLIASDEVSKSGSINEDTLSEINSMLSEEMAADVIEQANAAENIDGQTALDLFLENDINTATAKRQAAEAAARESANANLLSSMSGIELAPMAPEVNNAPPSVLSEVSDQQAQENYAAIQAQEQAYTQTLAETGDAIAAEAAGNAAYENAVAPKINDADMEGTVTVDNVVPIRPEIDNIASLYNIDAPNIPVNMDLPIVDNTTQPIDTRRPDMIDVLPSVEAIPNIEPTLSESAQYLRSIIGDRKSQLGEGTVVDNDLQTRFTEVEVPESTFVDTRRPDMLDVQPDASTEVNLAGTEVVIPENTDIANPPEGITISIEDEVPGMKTVRDVPKLLTDETVNNVAAEVPVETVTNRSNNRFVPYNTAYVPPGGDDNDDPVTPTFTETDDGVTVGLPVDTGGGTVAPALGVNVAGDPVMECPEGYELVDAPNGPTCVKIEESYRLRAGAGTSPYTGQTIRPGDTGPGQRRQQYDKRTYTAATSR